MYQDNGAGRIVIQIFNYLLIFVVVIAVSILVSYRTTQLQLTAGTNAGNTGISVPPVQADYEAKLQQLEDRIAQLYASGYDGQLKGKKLVYDGDSIAESRENNGGGYPQLIADMTGSLCDNQAVSGGVLCSHAEKHSIVNNLTNLPTDGDLYCFEGGINDFWLNLPLGNCDPSDYTSPVDPNTVCGAMETIFRYCLEHFPGKPVCFVITHKVQRTAHSTNANGDTFQDFHDAMVTVCEKYSIPYYDAFSESGLNGWNDVQNQLYLTANSRGEPDGCHPNKEGYLRYYVPQLIALFSKILPTAQTEP